ncbi:MAG: ABC transporter permease, partial [Chloroflexi bacterium]
MIMKLSKNEMLFFALRNGKLRVGLSVVLFFLVLSIIGPLLTDYEPLDYVGPASQPPSAEYWFGTTTFGQDVFTQFVHGLKATFLVGFIGGGLGTFIGLLVGFVAGYRGGLVDELLNMLTNIVLIIPTLAVLIIIAAYLSVRG